MGRPSNTEQRRREIVSAFEAVLAERGYDGATIAETARVAGLNAGLIHYHFASKHQMLLALIERLNAGLEARFQSRLERAGDDPLLRLEAFIDAHVALGQDSDPAAVASWVSIGAQAIHEPEVQALYAAALEQRVAELQALFAGALAARGSGTRGARDYAAAVAAAIEGAFQIASAAPSVLPRGFASRTIKRMARGLLDGAVGRAQQPKRPRAGGPP